MNSARLNNMGYQLLRSGKQAEAMALFRLKSGGAQK